MPVDPKVASRVRKLLALATSSNPNESASALASARRIMSRHGLTEEDVAVSGAEYAEVYLGWRGFDSAWKFDLASVAARALSCEALGLRAGRRRRVRVVGRREDAEEAAELFRYLVRELDRLARTEMEAVVEVLRERLPAHVRRLATCYLGDFREGAVAGFARSLRAAAGSATPAPPAEDGSLARVGGVGVREHLVARGAREVPRGGGDPVDSEASFLVGDEAYASGWRQARRVPVPASRRGEERG